VTNPFPTGYFLWWSRGTKHLPLTVSEIFNGKLDAIVDITLNDLYSKVKVIHFGTKRFLIYDFLGCQ